MFNGWKFTTNLDMHYNGRIWLTWRPDYFQVIVKRMNAQAVTCEIYNITKQKLFLLTVVYAYKSKDERKEL